MQEERDLIQLAQNGDMNAFRKLVERHQKRILWLAYDLSGNMQDAEDLSQEIFVKMFRSLKKFRGESKLSSWLYKITVNTWMSESRRGSARVKKMQEPLEEDLVQDRAHGLGYYTAGPEQGAEAVLINKQFRKAFELLSQRELSVFVMRHYHDCKITEIGKILDLSSGTVKSLLFRAVKKMQKRLECFSDEL